MDTAGKARASLADFSLRHLLITFCALSLVFVVGTVAMLFADELRVAWYVFLPAGIGYCAVLTVVAFGFVPAVSSSRLCFALVVLALLFVMIAMLALQVLLWRAPWDPADWDFLLNVSHWLVWLSLGVLIAVAGYGWYRRFQTHRARYPAG